MSRSSRRQFVAWLQKLAGVAGAGWLVGTARAAAPIGEAALERLRRRNKDGFEIRSKEPFVDELLQGTEQQRQPEVAQSQYNRAYNRFGRAYNRFGRAYNRFGRAYNRFAR